jgi:hypothetical protein
MDTLYLILYIAAALCFLIAAFVASVVTRTDGTVRSPALTARFNLVALGLLFWVLVPLIHLIDTMD